MIDGIQVLSSHIVSRPTILGLVAISIASLIFATIVYFIITDIFNVSEKFSSLLCTLLFILGVLFLNLTIQNSKITILVTHETEYKVLISDNVSFNEFQEKYKLIDRDGKVYTIKNKD